MNKILSCKKKKRKNGWRYSSVFTWVLTGGSLMPWTTCTDLLLSNQHASCAEETFPLNFRGGCLDKGDDVCMPGHKRKAFCGVIYCSNRPWQRLDSMVITNNQAPKEETRAFLLPGLAAQRSRWSQFHHGLQYFEQGRCHTAVFWGATEQPGSQKPGSNFFPTDSV